MSTAEILAELPLLSATELAQVRATIDALAARPSAPAARPFGLASGAFFVSDDFDRPLPDDVLRAFEAK